MKEYQLASELFTIPNNEGKTVLYFPLSGLLIDAGHSLMNLIRRFDETDLDSLNQEEKHQFDYLFEKGIITAKGSAKQIVPETDKHLPHKLTLFPTNDCNLECSYCYASGRHSRHLVMDWSIVESAVEFYVKLMHQEKRTIFNLELHGGGEPFHEWDLVQKMIGYIEEVCHSNNFKLEAVASTNGVLTKSQVVWITSHFTYILVSFEILPDIQNLQRPFARQKPSFEAVNKTIKYFDEADFPYGIRVTVTPNNENLLKETIDFVIENYRSKLIYFEPVNNCGNNEIFQDVDLKNFIKNFIALEFYAMRHGISIMYSGADYEKLTSNFCYVGTSQFAITPDGYLTNCWEVTDKDHPFADTFIFGKLKEKGELDIYTEKYNYLQSLNVQNIAYCKNCFARWHCAGDCEARLYHNGSEGSRGNDRCSTNREIIAHRLLQTLKQEC